MPFTIHSPARGSALAILAAMAVISAGAFLSGCSSVQPQVALPSASDEALRQEAAFEADASLERLQEQEARVAAVAFRLTTANVDLCPQKGPRTGLVLHDALQYGDGIRPYVLRRFGMAGFAGVLAVAPDSPAARAGVQPGDALVAVNGGRLPESPVPETDNRSASNRAKAKTQEQLDAAFARGPVRLTLRRAGQDRVVTVAPVPGCAYDFQLDPDKDLSASANGKTVFITTAMVLYAASDDDLAILLGHEMAHNVMQHQSRIATGGLAGKVLGNIGTTPGSLLTTEREADYVGLYLTARAGYDFGRAQQFWRRYGADDANARDGGWSHPGSLERSTVLGAAAREIEGKKARGEPLVPTPSGGRP